LRSFELRASSFEFCFLSEVRDCHLSFALFHPPLRGQRAARLLPLFAETKQLPALMAARRRRRKQRNYPPNQTFARGYFLLSHTSSYLRSRFRLCNGRAEAGPLTQTNMIAYIKGAITHKSPTFIIVEAGGLGYHINISLYTYARIEKLETLKLLTHLHIKEDAHTLYGFADAAERSLFVHLISVSGIGPNTAQLILSSMSPEEMRAAIISEDVAALQRIKGVGPKTAKRIILDLKDKMVKDSGAEAIALAPQHNTMREEALSALLALQFNRIQAQKALNKVLNSKPGISGVEELIKLALKELS
jgi:holliday junction DNA helicase RuvA